MTDQRTEDRRLCPKCQTPLEPFAEVDIGVGMLQGGPWGCPACHYTEDDGTDAAKELLPYDE